MLRAFLLIAACVSVAWYPALDNGYIWDDDEYVTQNQTLRSGEGLRQIWLQPDANWQYYPLVFTTFWLEYHLWGVDPFGYHLVNVLLHGAAAVLLFILLRRLGVPGALLCAVVFAVHPVHTESVAWISERKNVLSAVFYLLAFLTVLPLLKLSSDETEGIPAESPRSAAFRYFGVVTFFVAAMLSKTISCSLPAAVLLVVWWKTGKVGRRSIAITVPLFVAGLTGAVLTILLEKHQVGADGPEFAWSFSERCLIAGRAVWFYPAKLLWPTSLTFFYPKWDINTGSWIAWSYPVAAVALVILLGMNTRKFGRGPLVCVLFFGGTLLPALGFINVYPMRYSFVADHFQYLASIGILALVSGGLVAAARRLATPVLSTLTACVIVAALVVLTRQQCAIYKDAETLWRDTIAKNPSSAAAHNNLAEILLTRYNNRTGAIYHYRRSLEEKPQYNSTADIGLLLLEGEQHLFEGRPNEAIATLKRLTERYPSAPLIDRAFRSIAIAHAQLNRHEEAVEYFTQAVSLRPTAGTWTGMGHSLLALNRIDEARNAFGEALQRNPNDVAALRGMQKITNLSRIP